MYKSDTIFSIYMSGLHFVVTYLSFLPLFVTHTFKLFPGFKISKDISGTASVFNPGLAFAYPSEAIFFRIPFVTFF